MQLGLKSFYTILSDAVVAVQSSSTTLLNFTSGSVLRAILEANAAIGTWMQSIFYNVLLTTRLSTSGGTDCDSFGADFGFSRLPAIASSGDVTFSRFTFTQPASIPIGSLVSSIDFSEVFQVVVDTLNPLYHIATQTYIIPAGTKSGTVPVVCVTAGAAGNVGVGIIANINGTIANVDTVTNQAAYVNGADTESDPGFRTRFVAYISSLSRGTAAAIGFAITSVEQGVTYTIEENVDALGNALPGNMVITVNDGTGHASQALLTLIANQIELYRPVTVSYNLFPPVIINANIVFTVTPLVPFTFNELMSPAQSAVSSYVNSLAVGEPLYYSRIAQVAYDSNAGIANVNNLSINGSTADLVPNLRQTIRTTSVTVN